MHAGHTRQSVFPGGAHSQAEQDAAPLVKASQRGDRDAFALLVRRHQRRIFNLGLSLLHDEEEARQLWAHLDRPNLFIKIPAVAQGIPAIEACIAEGINVNVTLIFSLDAYERVILAYLSGLEKLAASGKKPLGHVASVASFFVSRVDTLVDHLLDEQVAATNEPSQQQHLAGLKGKAAIANAKLAYQVYRSYFVAGAKADRFKALQAQGAQVQRPLWASTSTKNPAYRDVMYVEELIGPHTVNTMPPATIAAFQDHGAVALTVEQAVGAAQQLIEDLRGVGIEGIAGANSATSSTTTHHD